MESYRSEDEQVEALRKWWDENGRSTLFAIVIGVGAAFGWQGWKAHGEQQAAAASDAFQSMMRSIEAQSPGVTEQAEALKATYDDTTYAQFAALHLARLASEAGDLAAAESELRWVLAQAESTSDIAQVTQIRLARVVAAQGNTEQALQILDNVSEAYAASAALATGDILLLAGRREDARQSYASAQALASVSGMQLPSLQAKLQSLSPQAPTFAADGSGDSGNGAAVVPAEQPAAAALENDDAMSAGMDDDSPGDSTNGGEGL